MARGRMISKSLGSSRKFHELAGTAGKLSEFFQLLYPLLVTHSDDFGRQAGDAFTVKHTVFPISPRPERDFEAALRAMHKVGLIILYDHKGKRYLQIVDFDPHQQGLHKRTTSSFPDPPQIDAESTEPPGNSGKLPRIPSEPNLTEPNRTKHSITQTAGDGFERFWDAYPRKVGKQDAIKAWNKARPPVEQVLEALARWSETQQWLTDNGRFIPHPTTWLNRRGWEDEPIVEQSMVDRVFEEMSLHDKLG